MKEVFLTQKPIKDLAQCFKENSCNTVFDTNIKDFQIAITKLESPIGEIVTASLVRSEEKNESQLLPIALKESLQKR